MKIFESFKQSVFVSKEVVKMIWGISKGYTIYITLILLASAFIPIFEAYFIKKIVDSLTMSLSQTIAFSSIITYLLIFFGITLFSRLIESQHNSMQVLLGNFFQKQINQKIVEKTTSLPFWLFEDPTFHDKLDRVVDQATWKPLNTFYYLFDAMKNILLVISVFVVLYALHPLILLALIIFAIPSLFVQIKYGSQWWNLIYQETAESRKLAYLQHLMSKTNDMKDIKLLNIKDNLLTKYKALYDKLFSEQKSLTVKRYFWEFLSYLVSDLVFVGFYFYLAWRAFEKKITIGDFTFYSTLYLRGVASLHAFVKDLAGIYENNLFVNELIEFLNNPEEEHLPQQKSPTIQQGFEFKNVWFKYPKTENWILKDISFKLPVKNSIALVGENGAGKTTIVKLLTRLYEPTKGQILLDGKPIGSYDVQKYRQLFGVAFQDFAKFFFTVEENIKLGDVNRKISNEELISNAKKTQIHKKIMSLPKKYQTFIGRWYHEGHELSHGEWQRVAIARALIRKAPIYILDEPTAALDARAEYHVFKQFKTHVKGRTALFISHRFSNVKLADKILVIENGKIIQQGNHQILINKKGRYRELYNFQAKQYVEKKD
ncbi:ABC transporter ATP-binding protein [Candidatus Woesearchaeota archaeon]|nr:ABC transporter ATP-binding protein [Candidatus Woesearchaeota archaeon]